MKSYPLTHLVVMADQRGSRHADDAVPAALAELDLPGLALPFERTAGDEIQALTDDPATAMAATRLLSRTPTWRIGIGVGSVETPLPASTREARGTAYVAAREAIEQAHSHPCGLALASASPQADVDDAGAIWQLLRVVWGRRSPAGWEVAALEAQGLTSVEIADHLGVSKSAISQRRRAAATVETAAAERAVERLLARALAG